MMGRNNDPKKRFELGIKSMKNIIKEIPNSQMNIISLPIKEGEELIQNLNLGKNVRFLGFQNNIEIFLRNSSFFILPSFSESYSMVLSEAKIFGIPSIICGLDYLCLAKRGTIIIYDDNPDTISKEAIQILKNKEYRKTLGDEARRSMKKIKNHIIIKKWIKLLISIYRGDEKYKELTTENENKITEKEAEKILKNQLQHLKRQDHFFREATLEQLKHYSF